MKLCCESGDAEVRCLLAIVIDRIGFYTSFSVIDVEAGGDDDEGLERLGRLVDDAVTYPWTRWTWMDVSEVDSSR